MDEATKAALQRVAAHLEARRWMFPRQTEAGQDVVAFAWDDASQTHELHATDVAVVLELAQQYVDLAD